MDIREKTMLLIDNLKAACQAKGLGNDGNEFKIITQVFLYKFLNDKFGYAAKKISPKLAKAENWESAYADMSASEQEDLLDELDADIPVLKPYHLISHLWNQQAKGDFDLIFDRTMVDIAETNAEIFATHTTLNTSIPLFEKLTNYVTDENERAPFARSLVDKLVKFSFEEAFEEHYDFFAFIFEYLISDYNTAGGGKYAEYYTPHAIAAIMAHLLVGDAKDLHNIECYDPSAGTGTLLMALGHQIGIDKCTVFAQDISQRSNKLLKLNLILNGLVTSLDHAIQGDTLVSPYHKEKGSSDLKKFDYIVSNPPFKMDFSDNQRTLKDMPSRFWAGVPNIPNKKFEDMAIYTLFIQHVINSLKPNGKGAIVVPTGFLTAQKGIEKKIRQKLIDNKWLRGVISMPPNIFANTGTNVSVLFFDKSGCDKVILIDASKLGEKTKIDNKQKTVLRDLEIKQIEDTFIKKQVVDDFSVVVSNEDIVAKGYSFSAGQYFDVKIEYIEMTAEEFATKMNGYKTNLAKYFAEGKKLEAEIQKQLEELRYEG